MIYKVKFHLPSGWSYIVNMDGNTKIGRYFKVYELANKKAKENIKLELWTESLIFIQIMDEVRDDVGSIEVNSFYRTYSYNLQIGGNLKSGHRKSVCMDIPDNYTRVLESFKRHCAERNIKAAINKYKGYTHLEAFSDLLYGQTKNFVIRDKT